MPFPAGYERESVALAPEKIPHTAQLAIEDHQEAWPSLREYKDGVDLSGFFPRRYGSAQRM